MHTISMIPVAFVSNDVRDKRRRAWRGMVSEITLTDKFSADALTGIEHYSHLEIIFHLHLSDDVNMGTSYPYGNSSLPLTGIFAMRKMTRPNHIATTVVRLVRKKGKTLIVKDLDAFDGTPVLDIKPINRRFYPKEPIRQPQWSLKPNFKP